MGVCNWCYCTNWSILYGSSTLQNSWMKACESSPISRNVILKSRSLDLLALKPPPGEITGHEKCCSFHGVQYRAGEKMIRLLAKLK